MISNKQKNVCTTLDYVEHFLILATTVSECTSISAFASLLGILVRTASSAIALKVCAITAGIKNL